MKIYNKLTLDRFALDLCFHESCENITESKIPSVCAVGIEMSNN